MNTDQQDTFMSAALEQARIAKENGELPFGAVVVKDNEIIAEGRCEEAALHTVLAHAELSAVNTACLKLGSNKLAECTIYCTNEPCPMCAAAIFQAKIPNVVIGASREDLSFLRARKIDIQALADDSGYEIAITRDVLKQEVLKLFTNRP
jgi:tRNA(Arg) A34 adenosine deaminase TadA